MIVDLVRMELSHAFLNGDLSMSGPAIKDQQQRFPLMGALKGVEDEYDIHLYGVNDVVKPLTYRENGSVDVNADLTVVPRSAIGTGILEVLRRHRGQSMAGIVLLTDGRVNRGKFEAGGRGCQTSLSSFNHPAGLWEERCKGLRVSSTECSHLCICRRASGF